MGLNRVYTAIIVVPLTLWTTTVLGFAAMDIINDNKQLIEPLSSISLLTYLACRLIVALNPRAQNASLAHLITTAHQRSLQGAIAMLIFSCSWLYELARKSVIMFFMTVFGGIMAVAIHSDSWEETSSPSSPSSTTPPELGESDEQQTALAKIDDFKANAGFDPTALFKCIPPKALIYFGVLVWINFGSLSLYVLRLAIRSINAVFGSSLKAGKSDGVSAQQTSVANENKE